MNWQGLWRTRSAGISRDSHKENRRTYPSILPSELLPVRVSGVLSHRLKIKNHVARPTEGGVPDHVRSRAGDHCDPWPEVCCFGARNACTYEGMEFLRSCCIPRRLLVVWMSAQQNIHTAEAVGRVWQLGGTFLKYFKPFWTTCIKQIALGVGEWSRWMNPLFWLVPCKAAEWQKVRSISFWMVCLNGSIMTRHGIFNCP